MPVLVYRNERSLGDLGDRLFSRLGSRQRERVEAALLEANPQLENLRDVPAGAILNVPDMPDLEHKRKPGEIRPGQLPDPGLARALDGFGEHLKVRVRQAEQSVSEQRALLKSVAFKRAWTAANHDVELSRPVTQALEQRSESLSGRAKLVTEALKGVREYLEKQTD